MKKLGKGWILIGCILILSGHGTVSGQISFGGIPESFRSGIKSGPIMISMPVFSVDSMLKTDSILSGNRKRAFHFAKVFEVNYSPLNSGKWDRTEDGTWIWRLAISSKNAYSIGLILKNYKPVAGSRIYLYNLDHRIVYGAFTSENVVPGQYLTIYPLPGETAIIEYDLPKYSSEKAGFTICTVAHDYRNVFSSSPYVTIQNLLSGSCNKDINCLQGANWQIEKRAVCKLVIGGSVLCTGFLVNNTRKDGRAFLITANHCVPTDTAAFRTLFIFNFEMDSCSGTGLHSIQSLSGSWLRATTANLDFALVELGEKPPYSFSPYYAGWSLDTVGIINGTTIHHPSGDVKKISIDQNPPVTGDFGFGYDPYSHWRITRWEVGTTEGGSSGAPLFNQNHLVIGDLSGGDATCLNSINDYFQKINRSWADYPDSSQQLKYWLDPDYSGIQQLDGMNPYPFFEKNCLLKTNILPAEQVINPLMPDSAGYFTGHNSLGITGFAEKFIVPSTLNLPGVYLNLAKAIAGSEGSYITLKFWKGQSAPDTLLFSQKVLIKSLKANSTNYLSLNRIVTVKDSFFIGYEINYFVPDTFALFMAPDRILSRQNSAFAFRSDSWTSFPAISEYNLLSTSLDLSIQSCDTSGLDIKTNRTHLGIQAYPNPTNGKLMLEILEQSNNIQWIRIYNIAGQMIPVRIIHNDQWHFELEMENLCSGIYFINVSTGNSLWRQKVIKF